MPPLQRDIPGVYARRYTSSDVTTYQSLKIRRATWHAQSTGIQRYNVTSLQSPPVWVGLNPYVLHSSATYGTVPYTQGVGRRSPPGTRLGSCTGDLRSCANVPSMGGQILFLNVVLCLFGHQQFGIYGKIPDGPCFMGAAGQKWPFLPVAYKGVRRSAWP